MEKEIKIEKNKFEGFNQIIKNGTLLPTIFTGAWGGLFIYAFQPILEKGDFSMAPVAIVSIIFANVNCEPIRKALHAKDA